MTVQELLKTIGEHTEADIDCFLCGIDWADTNNGLWLAENVSVDDMIRMIGSFSIDQVDWTIAPINDGEMEIGFLLKG